MMPREPGRQLLLHLCGGVHRLRRIAATSAHGGWWRCSPASSLQGWAFSWPLYVSVPTFIVAGIIGATNINVAEYRRRGLELRVARDAVVEMARIAERERIGRDLHDLLGHTLSVIVLKSELASKLAERDPARAVQEIRDVEQISRDALSEVRKAVRGYRSEGLSDAIANAERVLVAAGDRAPHRVRRRSRSSRTRSGRSPSRCAKRSPTSIRHAQARHCWITLTVVSRTGRARSARRRARRRAARKAAAFPACASACDRSPGTVERSGDRGTRLLITLPRGGTATGLAS